MKTKYYITFAGVPGSSKTPIAHHLSWNLGLPIFNNDTLRTEVYEDKGSFDLDEYEKRRDDRADKLMDTGKPFIYDASVDRAWELHVERSRKRGYLPFVISMDLSRSFIDHLYVVKGYNDFDLTRTMPEHEAFLDKYGDVVNLSISDETFARRLDLSLNAARSWIED